MCEIWYDFEQYFSLGLLKLIILIHFLFTSPTSSIHKCTRIMFNHLSVCVFFEYRLSSSFYEIMTDENA